DLVELGDELLAALLGGIRLVLVAVGLGQLDLLLDGVLRALAGSGCSGPGQGVFMQVTVGVSHLTWGAQRTNLTMTALWSFSAWFRAFLKASSSGLGGLTSVAGAASPLALVGASDAIVLESAER